MKQGTKWRRNSRRKQKKLIKTTLVPPFEFGRQFKAVGIFFLPLGSFWRGQFPPSLQKKGGREKEGVFEFKNCKVRVAISNENGRVIIWRAEMWKESLGCSRRKEEEGVLESISQRFTHGGHAHPKSF